MGTKFPKVSLTCPPPKPPSREFRKAPGSAELTCFSAPTFPKLRLLGHLIYFLRVSRYTVQLRMRVANPMSPRRHQMTWYLSHR